MKKLLFFAAFSFIAVTATLAQTADRDAAGQEPAKATISADKPAAEALAPAAETPAKPACCKSKAGASSAKACSGSSSKACCSSHGAGKSCSHDHADATGSDSKSDAATPSGTKEEKADTPNK